MQRLFLGTNCQAAFIIIIIIIIGFKELHK